MNFKIAVASLWVIGMGFTNTIYGQKNIIVNAQIKEATLYLNSAELNHQTHVNLKKGLNEVVVNNVADVLDNNSIRVSANKPITIMSVGFTNSFYTDNNDHNSTVQKAVKDSIDWVNKEINRNENKISTNRQTIQMLDKNQSVGGANTGVNLTELTQVVDYYQKKRLELSNSLFDLEIKQTDLKNYLEQLKNKLSLNEQKNEKISKGKIVMQLMSNTEQSVQLQFTYITNLAHWQPFYELEAKGVNQPINLISKAKIFQKTGLDWTQIKMTFSSTQPNPNNAIPYFNQWSLRFTNPVAVYANPVDKRPYKAPSVKSMSSSAQEVAGDAFEDASNSAANYTQVTEQSLSVNYELKLLYDVRSNSQPQSVDLAVQEMKAIYNYYAAPKLNKDVYLVAGLLDYAQYNLLRGEANIIFEGKYVGKTFIDPSITKDTFQIPLGVDKNIIVKRTIVNEKSGNKIFSGSRQSDYNYNISIRNNKNATVRLILKDQFPLSTDKEIKVELTKTDKAAVDDDLGTLTWDLDIKANKTENVQFGYKVSYPKDKSIQNL
ncbi:MAG TPA: DUF4139 domain-containing protein [Edaphocola sp.]|nr:DUF4139 domain-containing protein [Edaphocola sp.]